MADRFTVVVAAPDVDACAAAALVGRCAPGHTETLVFDSERLAAFFEHPVQQKLPHGYDLVFCGSEVVHTDWDGRLVRPKLMDALRSHIGPVRWFAAYRWDPVDRQAIEQMIGRGNLVASDTADSTAALVAAHYGLEDDAYARQLLDLRGRESRGPGRPGARHPYRAEGQPSRDGRRRLAADGGAAGGAGAQLRRQLPTASRRRTAARRAGRRPSRGRWARSSSSA